MARKLEACIVKAQAAGMSRQDAEELVDMMAGEKRRLAALAAQGKLDRAEVALADFARRTAKEAQINAALQRKHAALNVLRRRDVEGRLSALREQGVSEAEAVMAILGGSHKRVEGARASVSRALSGIRDRWLGGLSNELAQRPHVLELLSLDQEFMDDVVREMHEIKPKGRPGVTGNADAAFVADIFSRYAEQARVRLNEAGAFIGKLQGWVPQTHDVGKMMAKTTGGSERWVDFVLERLDLERSFPDLDPAKAREALAEVYQTIVTGRDRSVTAAQRGQFLGPRNLAKSQGKSRVLHFKDAEGFIQYQNTFGRGNVLTNVLDHLDLSARKLALMESLGPNPEAVLVSVIEDRKRSIRTDKALAPKEKTKRIEQLNRAWNGGLGRGRIRNLFAELTGETFIPENMTAAKIGAGIRAVQSLAKQGGVLLSQFNDLATYAMSARVNGKNLGEAYLDGLRALLDGRTEPDRRALAHSLGTMLDGMIQDMTLRWNAQDSIPGTIQRWMNFYFKASGMTGWTERLKAGYAHMFSNNLAEHRGKAWAELGEDLRGVLQHHGFDETHWDLMRKLARQETGGRWYVLPENVRLLQDADIDRLLPHDVRADVAPIYRKKARERFETDLQGMIADEVRYAVLEPDERTRSFLVQGTRPGSVLGEVVRFVAQFKSFPVAYTQRILGGRRWARTGRGFDMPGFTHFIAAGLALGYASMAAKDITKGRTPKDPAKVETWLAAAAQGGGAGIWGDFLLSKYNRFGGGPIDTLAGPALGSAGDLVKMGSRAIHGDIDLRGDAFRLALDNAPFINLFYTRAALDWAVLNHVREMLSPGTLRRADRRMEQEFGQKPLWPADAWR